MSPTQALQSLDRSVSVQIPPPPIPEPSRSLFPTESIPKAPNFTSEPAPEIELISDLDSNSANELARDTELEQGDLDIEVRTDEAKDGPTLVRLREEAHNLADRGLRYKFGADDPDSGGLDCSGAMQYLLTKIGVEDVPRTSYDQYYWLKRKKKLDDVYGKNASSKMFKKLAPGDLIFWGGTWKSGHKVSHVMLYMGYDPNEDKHYVFGARGKSSKGILGNGVDIFELDPDRGRLIAHGKIPGLVY